MQSRAEDGHKQDGEEDRRKGHPDVDDARHDLVDDAAVVACEQPEHATDQASERSCDKRDGECDAAAIDNARKDVAAEPVSAEQVAGLGPRYPRRREPGEEQVLLQRIMRSDERGEGRRERHDQQPGACEDQAPGARTVASHDGFSHGGGEG